MAIDKALIFPILLGLVASQAPPTPGIRAALSQGAVNLLKDAVIAAIIPRLNNVSIPFFISTRTPLR